MEFVSLELELSVERLKRYLQQHPEKAAELAISYFEERPRVAVRRKGMRDKDFSVLAIEHKRLERSHEMLQQENIRLKSSIDRQSPSLPSFLNSKRGVS